MECGLQATLRIADFWPAIWIGIYSDWKSTISNAGKMPALPGKKVILLLKNLLFTVLVPGTVAFYIPYLLTRNDTSTSGVFRIFALIVFILGSAIYAWCIWDFATFGRGTPIPIDAPKKLVVRGLYRYTRNPMYVGVLTIIAGWAILFQSLNVLLYLLLVTLGFYLFVVLYEEPHLRKLFGNEYDEYCVKVPRWIRLKK